MSVVWTFDSRDAVVEAFPSEWQRLVDAHCGGNPALDARFMRQMLRHYGTGSELVARATAAGEVVASCIVTPEGIGRWTLFQPGQACLSPFVHSREISIGELLPSLMSALPRRCLRLRLPKIDPLFQDLPSLDRNTAESSVYGTTFLVEFDDDFDSYWDERKKRLRQNCRRWFRKLEQVGYKPRLERLDREQDMPRAVDFHARLESSGWKGEHGSAIGVDNRQGTFYSELLSEFARQGKALTFQLYLDDTPAASLLGIVGNGTIVILKTAHNENLRDYSPGRVIDYLALKHCFENGSFRAMDMYTRASPADLSWSTAERDISIVDVYSSPALLSAVRLLRRFRRGS